MNLFKLRQFHHASSLNCVNPIYSARLADSTFLEGILVILISRPVLYGRSGGFGRDLLIALTQMCLEAPPTSAEADIKNCVIGRDSPVFRA